MIWNQIKIASITIHDILTPKIILNSIENSISIKFKHTFNNLFDHSIIKKDKDRLFNNQGETIYFIKHDGGKNHDISGTSREHTIYTQKDFVS